MTLLTAAALVLAAAAWAAPPEPLSLKAGSLELPGIFEPSAALAGEAKPRVVVLIHGSGPNDRDENLADVSAPGKPCVFFRDLAKALLSEGFSVVRYDKRSFVYKEMLVKDAAVANSKDFLAYQQEPLSATIADVDAAVAWARKRLPNARVYLLGHSQGAYIALQTAHRDPGIAGAALISLPAQPTQTLIFEQLVYRPLSYFEELDKDRDGMISPAELAGDDALRVSVRGQLVLLDRDGDGRLSKDEFMAGNLSNILAGPPLMPPGAAAEEARLPAIGEILAKDRFPVAIFSGALDNQTPLYHAYAVAVANDSRWKRRDLTVRVFPGLGHALDPRDGPADLVFKPSDPAALAAVAAELDAAWK